MPGALEAATSTALARTTVHAQYNGKALGVVMLNNLVPIVLHVPKPGRPAYRAVLNFGGVNHKHPAYKDLGVRRKCCRQVIRFNLIHFTKCYLTDDHGEDAPYSFNQCRKCSARLKDACGHIVQVNKVRRYNVDKYIFKAATVLPGESVGQLFEYQIRNT